MPALGSGPGLYLCTSGCGTGYFPSPQPCGRCKAGRSPEDRRDFIRAGIARTMGSKDVGAPTREDVFETERKRLAKKRKRAVKR